MRASDASKCRSRLRELAILHALGTITPAELAKLARYQALLRRRPTQSDRACFYRHRWQCETAMKALLRAIRASKCAPQ